MLKNDTVFYMCNPEFKLKMIDLYGEDNPSKLENFKNKKKETWLKKYGVDNPSKVLEIHIKQHSGYILKYYDSDLYYRGSYEYDFIEYCMERNINIKNYGKSIEYICNNEKHIYYPDFYLSDFDLIVEIKSTYTYEYDLQISEAKQKYALKHHNFIFIIDKKYDIFEKLYTKKTNL